MRVLKKNSKRYKENLKHILSSRWLEKKHVKHSRIVVAAFGSWVQQSKDGYRCMICEKPGACYNIRNKRKSDKKEVNIRYCAYCKEEIEKVFPAKYHYCG